jgi:hypothetical protein
MNQSGQRIQQTRRAPRRLRLGLILTAAALIALAAFLLHRPLTPQDVEAWNPLVAGYTVVQFFPAAVFILCAATLALISLSRSRDAMRRRLRKFLTASISSAVCLVLLDIILSIFPRLQSAFIDSSLFLPGSDLQVQDKELGYRLKPHINRGGRFDPSRAGNLIAEGQVVNPEATGEESTDVELRTDDAGFCNDAAPAQCDIVATGDSYVAQSPVPREDYWPVIAARQLSMSLYNLGVGGYGPQQELGVLKRYGLPKNPKYVLWGFFEGNDIRDAVNFWEYEKSGVSWLEFNGVSKMKFPYTRPTVRLMMFLVKALGMTPSGPKSTSVPYPAPLGLKAGGVERPVSFERGAFRTLTLSRGQLMDSAGWTETTKALREARESCLAKGAKLIVVFLPDKFSVFADEALARFERDKEEIFAFVKPALSETILRDASGGKISAEKFVEILRENHAAQLEALKDFCAKEGIEFLDTTPALRESLKAGKWPYYSYDTHVNITGENVIAATVASFIKSPAPPQVP